MRMLALVAVAALTVSVPAYAQQNHQTTNVTSGSSATGQSESNSSTDNANNSHQAVDVTNVTAASSIPHQAPGTVNAGIVTNDPCSRAVSLGGSLLTGSANLSVPLPARKTCDRNVQALTLAQIGYSNVALALMCQDNDISRAAATAGQSCSVGGQTGPVSAQATQAPVQAQAASATEAPPPSTVQTASAEGSGSGPINGIHGRLADAPQQ
jgi:hypothetical protein